MQREPDDLRLRVVGVEGRVREEGGGADEPAGADAALQRGGRREGVGKLEQQRKKENYNVATCDFPIRFIYKIIFDTHILVVFFFNN